MKYLEEKWQIQRILMIIWLNWCRLNYMYTKEIFDNMVILVTICKNTVDLFLKGTINIIYKVIFNLHIKITIPG